MIKVVYREASPVLRPFWADFWSKIWLDHVTYKWGSPLTPYLICLYTIQLS